MSKPNKKAERPQFIRDKFKDIQDIFPLEYVNGGAGQAWPKAKALLHLGEEQLQRHFFQARYVFDLPIAQQLRVKFWKHYEDALIDETRVNAEAVCGKICPPEFLEERIKNPYFLAWFMYPSKEEIDELNDNHSHGRSRMSDILKVPAVTYFCKCHEPVCLCPPKVDYKLANLHAKIYNSLDARKHGMYTQTINQKTLQVSLNSAGSKRGKSKEITAGETAEELQAQIASLKELVGKTQEGPDNTQVGVINVKHNGEGEALLPENHKDDTIDVTGD